MAEKFHAKGIQIRHKRFRDRKRQPSAPMLGKIGIFDRTNAAVGEYRPPSNTSTLSKPEDEPIFDKE